MGYDDEGLNYEIDESSRDEGVVYIRSNTSLGLAAAIEEVHMWVDEKGEWNCTPEENMTIDEDADDDDLSKYTHTMVLHEYDNFDED
ncbi:hypothetical protein OAV27_01280 [Euryarchaeota archaeon]|nr:hypothetical protein [Euryarchaeota archaeon]